MTQNPKKRIDRHNNGREKTTKPYKPFKLIFLKKIEGSRAEARIREKYWKSGIGKERLKRMKDIKIDINKYAEQ